MFGIDLSEFLVIIAVAVIVIGPKDLPRVLYTFGKYAGKVKKMAEEVKSSLDDVMMEGHLEEITREANKAGGDNLQFEIDRQIEEENKKKASNG